MGRAPLALGNHNVAILPNWKTDRKLYFWAEHGCICCEDSRDNSYVVMDIKTFLARIQAINDMVGNSLSTVKGKGMPSDYVHKLQQFVDVGLNIARIAQNHGLPSEFTRTTVSMTQLTQAMNFAEASQPRPRRLLKI